MRDPGVLDVVRKGARMRPSLDLLPDGYLHAIRNLCLYTLRPAKGIHRGKSKPLYRLLGVAKRLHPHVVPGGYGQHDRHC